MVDVHNEAVDITYLILSTPLYRQPRNFHLGHHHRSTLVYLSLSASGTTPAAAAPSVHLQPMVHPPPPPAHPFPLRKTSMAIFSCRHRVQERIEWSTDDALEGRKKKTAPILFTSHLPDDWLWWMVATVVWSAVGGRRRRRRRQRRRWWRM